MTSSAKERFFALVEGGAARLSGAEALLAYFVGEVSDFVRFNRAQLWHGYTGPGNDSLQTEIPERWLEAAAYSEGTSA